MSAQALDKIAISIQDNLDELLRGYEEAIEAANHTRATILITRLKALELVAGEFARCG